VLPKFCSKVIVTALIISSFVLPVANAQPGTRYTLTLPFERTFEEKGSFKPPLKFTKSDISTVLRVSCGVYVGEKPEVNIRPASGKSINPVKMKPGHIFTSSGWSKDSYGENIYTFRGTCVYVGTIPKNLPPSNFYQFMAYAKESYRESSWSYPYTLKELQSMKGGIKETRSMGLGVTVGSFLPVPDLEVPKVQILSCFEGKLFKNNFDGDGQLINIAYFAVTNGVYRPERPEFTSPSIEQFGNRRSSGEDFYIEYESLNRIESISEKTPTFITWRMPNDGKFVTSLRSMYKVWGEGIEPDIAREKSFDVEIMADCKSTKTLAR
jgi:hypothetical protein